MFYIRRFLFFAFIHSLSLQHVVLVNENGQIFKSFDNLATSLKTMGAGESPKAPKEQKSTNINSHSANDARLVVIIGSFAFD